MRQPADTASFNTGVTNMPRLIATRNVLVSVGTLIFLLCGIGTAQTETFKAIDDYVAAEMQRQRLPGVSLAVVKNGTIVYAKGYGYSNLEHHVPVKPETIFQSGSVGKQFTATAVMML